MTIFPKQNSNAMHIQIFFFIPWYKYLKKKLIFTGLYYWRNKTYLYLKKKRETCVICGVWFANHSTAHEIIPLVVGRICNAQILYFYVVYCILLFVFLWFFGCFYRGAVSLSSTFEFGYLFGIFRLLVPECLCLIFILTVKVFVSTKIEYPQRSLNNHWWECILCTNFIRLYVSPR